MDSAPDALVAKAEPLLHPALAIDEKSGSRRKSSPGRQSSHVLESGSFDAKPPASVQNLGYSQAA
jgi:hypothetical protein